MPHTWIVWGIYAQSVHSHIAIQEMSVAHHPFAFENYHIFRLGLTKNTFNMSAIYSIALQN